MSSSESSHEWFVVESIEDGAVEVEFASGGRGEWPAAWFAGEVAEGDGFRAEMAEGALRFVPDARAARLVRERNKQTLLDFHDEHDEHPERETGE